LARQGQWKGTSIDHGHTQPVTAKKGCQCSPHHADTHDDNIKILRCRSTLLSLVLHPKVHFNRLAYHLITRPLGRPALAISPPQSLHYYLSIAISQPPWLDEPECDAEGRQG